MPVAFILENKGGVMRAYTTLNMDTSAFYGNPNREMARVLRNIADMIEDEGDCSCPQIIRVHDSNNVVIGDFCIEDIHPLSLAAMAMKTKNEEE
jgi:hypothetical protein